MPIRSYEDALAFWFGRINYEQTGMPNDLRALKLERMQALLARLGQPQQRLRIVHIAGSKGKGSTAAMLASVLQAAGYRTGLFTSPHLCRVEERVQINGQAITPSELTHLMREIENACTSVEAAGHGPPTFFEIITALGWLHFERRRVEWAVIEVGLGGRFDSTNVCRPRVAVITSISLDHVQQLGPTLAHIAREKAGIIKPGIPVISGVTDPEPAQVIRHIAQHQHAPLRELGTHFDFEYFPGRYTPETWYWPRLRYTTRKAPMASYNGSWAAARDYTLNLWGRHQAANAAVALAVVDCLREQGVLIPETALVEGLRSVRWPARVEVVRDRPLTILDCAHNRASMAALVQTLRDSFTWRRLLVILGCSRDKDIPGMLAELAPVVDAIYFTRYSASPRAVDPHELAQHWPGHAPCYVYPSPEQAWKAASSAAEANDLICITGSVFLAGELRPIIAPASLATRPAATEPAQT
ncbi:MAG: bifunctional folylpolyglutamate synthase/dihydrofolate synthase [Gemmatales bacterium]|nr:bifunctional folylpolyglutamate synthase/dihydrofolate synthase [Gemmatales bacterium]